MKRDEDGYLSACFLSKNETPVEVQFGFELVNSKSEHSKRTGKGDRICTFFEVERCSIGHLHEFSFIDDCSEDKLLPCIEIASPDNGFLRDDHFLLHLDMRVKQEDNESCEVTLNGKTATCQVSFMFDALSCS